MSREPLPVEESEMRYAGFGIFVVLPILEIVLMIRMDRTIGIGNTFLLLLAAAAWGLHLIRRAGLRTLRAWQESMDRHDSPGNALLDGLIHFLAGVLLVVPGFLTDGLAILLLFPPTRFILKRWLLRYARERVATGQGPQHPPGGASTGLGRSQTIDGEFRHEDP
ncbi:MAG: FxsA family protein [Magnetococcales bacterium]|nr:FxsA family protein [Magnetococcales bacterium]MBF0323283.1 FxsA family protein [Magnetococcales bacterium]